LSQASSSPAEPTGEETVAAGEAEAVFELAQDSNPAQAIDAPEIEPPASRSIPEPDPLPSESPAPQGQLASAASVEKAIEEVNAVVEALRTSLEDMEEVLEMLEVFERQKNVDEREIESLRRALRQVHRPRDSGHHHHR
jgi:hypothetical protein